MKTWHDAWSFLSARPQRVLAGYLIPYGLFSAACAVFYPTYGFPAGDEATYYSYAMHPFSLISEFFQGYGPKEMVNPFNFRLFLTPFSLVFAIFGFTYVGARWVLLAYGLALLWLTYRIGARVASPWIMVALVVLFSWSPLFLFLTHSARPEGLMALWIMLGTWLILRKAEPVSVASYGWVGLVAASALWIHYNGIVLYPLFFVLLMFYDRSHVNLRKIAVYAVSGIAFFAVYALINLLPAWSTIETYGWFPETYISDNRVPLLELASGNRSWGVLRQPLSYYGRVLIGRIGPDKAVIGYSLSLLLPALAALVLSRKRDLRLLAALGLFLVLAMVFVFPVQHWQYLLYGWPLMVIFAASGFTLFARHQSSRLAIAIWISVVLCGFVFDAAGTFRICWQNHRRNQAIGPALQRALHMAEAPSGATIIGPQEFHIFAPNQHFRTFHSLIETGGLRQTLRLIKPDVIVVTYRAIRLIATLEHHDLVRQARRGRRGPDFQRRVQRLIDAGLAVRAGPPRGFEFVTNAVGQAVQAELAQSNYYRIATPGATWNGQPVYFYIRLSAERIERLRAGSTQMP